MRKTLGTFLVVLLSFAMLVGCGQTNNPSTSASATPASSTQPAASANPDTTAGIYDNIAPLGSPTDLSIGYLTGSHHGMISYMIQKLGGFEKVGINASIQVFGNGPVMVEATDSWDCGAYGIGGTLTGVISQGHYIIGAAARDYNTLDIFARTDSPIVKAGKTLADYPNLYGTADAWKGTEVYVPTGTTLQYVLATGLSKFEIKDTDIKMTHMDVPSINTALQAGQGEVGALWGAFALNTQDSKDFTMVMSANDLGIELPIAMVANPKSYDDPVKHAAIEKWMELYFATVNWINASEDNFNKAAQMFTDINDEQGVKSTVEQNSWILKHDCHYTLDENYKMYHTKSADGTMSLYEKMNYDPLMFFIQAGNYKPEDAQKFLGGYFKSDMVDDLYNAKNK